MTNNQVVVDTNVPIVANGREIHVDENCRLACVETILRIQTSQTVVMDESRAILTEYRMNLNLSGQPGIGDRFFKYVWDNMYSGARIMRVSITESDDAGRGFEELPENRLDPSDRKFLAVAVVSGASIVNATDSDWEEQRALLDSLSVDLIEVCPDVIEEHRRRRDQ